MQLTGWILFFVGMLLLILVGFIGIEIGDSGFRGTNLSGLAVGAALTISGAVLVAAGEIQKVSIVTKTFHEEITEELRMMVGYPSTAVPDIEEIEVKIEPDNSINAQGYSRQIPMAPMAEPENQVTTVFVFDGEKYKNKEDAIQARDQFLKKYARTRDA